MARCSRSNFENRHFCFQFSSSRASNSRHFSGKGRRKENSNSKNARVGFELGPGEGTKIMKRPLYLCAISPQCAWLTWGLILTYEMLFLRLMASSGLYFHMFLSFYEVLVAECIYCKLRNCKVHKR